MASEFTATAENTVTCPVCYEFFVPPNTPKDLACPHACCERCLQRMVTMNVPGQPIECPMRCANKTPVPREGVQALKTNLHLKNLAEQHPNYTGGPRHTVPKCAHHDEKTQLYCQHCNQLACHYCILAFHQGRDHSSKDVRTTSQAWKQELGPVLNDVRGNEKKYRENVQKLKDLRDKTLQNRDTEKHRVDESAQRLHQEVDQEKNKLKTQLDQQTQARIAEIDHQTVKLTDQADRLKAAGIVANETKASSDYAYITQHASLLERMKKLLVDEEVSQATCASEITQESKFLERKDLPDLKPGRVATPRQLQLVQEIGGLDNAYHIACSPDGLIIFSEFDKKKVLVYRRQHGQYEQHITLQSPTSNTSKPCGVAVCKNGKFILGKHSGIEVYSAAGKYEKTIKTQHNVDTGVWSVITMPDGGILAGDKSRHVITKHNPTGEITQTINTDIKPYYMTLIHDNHVAMSDYCTDRISVMNMKTGQETLSIDVPKVEGICYDENTECLLIARSEPADDGPNSIQLNTGVIEQYCCITGKLVACLIEGLYHPYGIAMSPDGNLFVCDEKSVKIYKLI